MATICQLHADLRYYLCLEPVDMRKQFQVEKTVATRSPKTAISVHFCQKVSDTFWSVP